MDITGALRLFSADDGTLPEVEFQEVPGTAVRESYLFIQSCASRIESVRATFWSKLQQAEIPIEFGTDPVQKLLDGEAEPFHLVFGGVESPSGKTVPALGVFVFETTIAIDYRMGVSWNLKAVEGFFEILDRIANIIKVNDFLHKENINDHGEDLLQIWQAWRKRHAA